MGVRIFTYAVDVPRFDTLLDCTVGELLCQYSRDGLDPNERLIFIHGDADDTLSTTPNGRITGALTDESGRHYVEIAESEIVTIPMLRRSAREHLSELSNYQLKWILSAFSHCAGIDYIHCLIDGHRRWWIGGLLQFAKEAIPTPDYDDLVLLCRKILRGWNCGFPIPDGDVGFTAAGLSFTPDNEPHCLFGRLTAEESSRLATLLSDILSLSPTFSRPPGRIGIAPDDAEWNQWVHKNVTAFLRIKDLDFRQCHVFTFID